MFLDNLFIIKGPKKVETIVNEIIAVINVVSSIGVSFINVKAPISAIASGVDSWGVSAKPINTLLFNENSLNCEAKNPLINLVINDALIITTVMSKVSPDNSSVILAFVPMVIKNTGIKIP